jgi:hypothetical protein
MTKRTGFLQLEEIPLNKVGLSIRAYGKKKNYVGRVEINHAGLAAFTGPKGKKCTANLTNHFSGSGRASKTYPPPGSVS